MIWRWYAKPALSGLFLECFSVLECCSFAIIRTENSVNFNVSLMIFHQRGFFFVSFSLFLSSRCRFNEVLDPVKILFVPLTTSSNEVPLKLKLKSWTIRKKIVTFRRAEIDFALMWVIKLKKYFFGVSWNISSSSFLIKLCIIQIFQPRLLCVALLTKIMPNTQVIRRQNVISFLLSSVKIKYGLKCVYIDTYFILTKKKTLREKTIFR